MDWHKTTELLRKKKILEDEEKFSKAIDSFMSGELDIDNALDVTEMPSMLYKYGAKPRRIEITLSVLNKVLFGKHSRKVSDTIIKKLPRAIHQPLMIV